MLNDQQKELLGLIKTFVDTPYSEDNYSFVICGCAGVGKTYILSHILQYIDSKRKYIPIFLSSPTHRANAVLKQNNPTREVATIHSLFGIQPNIALEQFDARNLLFQQSNLKAGVARNAFLVIDECSMINDALFDYIITSAKALRVKLLFVGDSKQISPVNQAYISKTFTEVNNKYELTKVERTGDNPLLKEITDIRHRIHPNCFSYISDVNEQGEGVTYITNVEDFIQGAVEIFKSPRFKENPMCVKVLSATNKNIAILNINIRKRIFGELSENQYNVGDVLMGYDNFGQGLFGPQIINSGDYIVKSVGQLKEKSYDGILALGQEILVKNILMEAPDEVIFMLSKLNDRFTFDKLGERFEKLRQKAIKTKRSVDWKAFYEFKDQIATPVNISYEGAVKIKKTLDYGYALSVHKSQASTIENVFLESISIDKSFDRDKDLKAQLQYVAMSRASKHVTVLYK